MINPTHKKAPPVPPESAQDTHIQLDMSVAQPAQPVNLFARVRQLVNEIQAAYILHRANRATARRIARQDQVLYGMKSSAGEKGGQR